MNIIKRQVRNYTAGRLGHKVIAVVIHVADGWVEGGYSWFNNPSSQASSHYMIGKDGRVHQFVNEWDTAWHAGGINEPTYPFKRYHDSNINPNLYTIGIENEGFSKEPFTPQLIQSNKELLFDIAIRYGWRLYTHGLNILEHADINSISRRGCPGIGIHMHNDLINPVNILLKNYYMKNEQLLEKIRIERKYVTEHNNGMYNSVEKIRNWWDPFGWIELNRQLAKWGINITRYSAEEALDLYLSITDKNIWNEPSNKIIDKKKIKEELNKVIEANL